MFKINFTIVFPFTQVYKYSYNYRSGGRVGGGGDFACYELSPNKNRLKTREKVSNFLTFISLIPIMCQNQCWAGIKIL